MNIETGELKFRKDIEEVEKELKSKFVPIPSETKIDTVCKLQNKNLDPRDRERILKALNKRAMRAEKRKAD